MTRMIALLVLLIGAGRLQAGLPDQLNYQGRMVNLTGSAAVPDSLTNSATFKIYDALTGGTLLWSETQTNIATKQGLFNVILGSVVPLTSVPFDAPYWLEVTWDKLGVPEVMSPRQPLTSSPYALRARSIGVPLSLTGTSPTTTLSIYNTAGGSGGSAILGISTGSSAAGVIGRDDTTSTGALGVYGIAQSGRGVMAQSSTGTGLYAIASNGTGLEAQGNGLGLSATATNAGGVAGYFSANTSSNAVQIYNIGPGEALYVQQSSPGTAAVTAQASGGGAAAFKALAGNGTAFVGSGSIGLSVTATSSPGIDVYNANGGTSINLTNNQPFATGLQAGLNGSNATGLNVNAIGANGKGAVINATLFALSGTANGSVAAIYGYNFANGEGLSGQSNSGTGAFGQGAIGVQGLTPFTTGIGVRAINTQASLATLPAIALDIDGGIQVKARADAPAGTQNVGTPNLVGAVNPYRFGNGNLVSNQILSNSVILLTPQCPLCSNNVNVSTKLTSIVDGQANYSVIVENSNGTDPGNQNVYVHYLIINQR